MHGTEARRRLNLETDFSLIRLPSGQNLKAMHSIVNIGFVDYLGPVTPTGASQDRLSQGDRLSAQTVFEVHFP